MYRMRTGSYSPEPWMVTVQPLLINWEIYPSTSARIKNLARLLDSSHRDRPKGRRGILSWNFSLVMHQLNKAPFGPIKEASLKHLTFKMVFLLGQGNVGVRFMLGKQILDTNPIGQRCPHIHYTAFYPEISWPRV